MQRSCHCHRLGRLTRGPVHGAYGYLEGANALDLSLLTLGGDLTPPGSHSLGSM